MAHTGEALEPGQRHRGVPPERHVRVFISYRRHPPSDLIAVHLHDFLTDHGIDVWRDVGRIAPGDAWRADIAQAINASDAVVALISSRVSESHEVRSELEYARRQRKRIIPVFVEPVASVDDATLLVIGGLDWIDLYRDADAGYQRLLGFLLSVDTTGGAHSTERTRSDALSQMTSAELAGLIEELQQRLTTGIEDVEGHLALGLCLLHRGEWRSAHRHFARARALDAREARASYFAALALTQGRRPRALRSSVFDEVDRLLGDAQAADETAGIYPYVRALFRWDFYENNGMLVPEPAVDRLIGRANTLGVDDDEIHRLHHLIPDSRGWQ